MDKTITLTEAQLSALIDCLGDVEIWMDDDGNDGAFEASPLFPIYQKLRAARKS
tara:strand:+ start:440 stop:601 length:162 start_codon:yes stop_codon:yes gene_type:complete